MKRAAAATGLLILVTLCAPALAQNAGQIARARAGSSCPKCNLFQADFSGAQLKGKDFSGARLRQADLSSSVMNRTKFSDADMRDVNAYAAVFSNADFARANLTHASFVGTYLQGASLAGATLEGTNFSGAEMDHARGLTQRQLDAACGDSTTRLPSGLRLRDCR
jgi:uncharacterized protein YjbI with pentapeptide repeats